MVQAAPGGSPEGARPEGFAPAPLSVRTPLFSPLGYIIVLIILVVEGALVYMIASFLHSGAATAGPGNAIGELQVDKLDLDELEISFDVTDPVRTDAPVEQHSLLIKPIIYFEKSKEGSGEIIKYATNIKGKLRDVISTMLETKGYRPLRQPGVLEEMKLDIRDRLNQELKSQVVKEVVYDKKVWR